MLDQEEDLDRILHALGDRNRRRMIERLSGGPASVSQLAEGLTVTLAAVVQHVQVLEHAGIVESRKIGRVRQCTLNGERLRPVDQWIADRRAMLAAAFDRLGEMLVEPPTRPRRKQ